MLNFNVDWLWLIIGAVLGILAGGLSVSAVGQLLALRSTPQPEENKVTLILMDPSRTVMRSTLSLTAPMLPKTFTRASGRNNSIDYDLVNTNGKIGLYRERL